MNIIKKYYKRCLGYSRIRFILELAFLSLAVRIIIVLIIGVLVYLQFNMNSIPLGKTKDFTYLNHEYPFFVITIGFIVPFIETFTQWIPIVLLKKITNNYLIIIILTALLFSFFHYSYGILYAILMFPSGLALSWSFYCKYKKSLREAYFATFAIHSIHNFVSIFLIILSVITEN